MYKVREKKTGTASQGHTGPHFIPNAITMNNQRPKLFE
uniref:Uncharacterized protein n=1 Tax=Anguilla anguilla TaxID=7936 RepID=A0A0E9VJH1_ANGAN